MCIEEGENGQYLSHVRIAQLSRDVPDVLSQVEIMPIFIKSIRANDARRRAKSKLSTIRKRSQRFCSHLVNFLTRKEDLASSLGQRDQGETRTSAQAQKVIEHEKAYVRCQIPGGRGLSGTEHDLALKLL